MQVIMRYELVINEALRSALMFDTPDEQINEFIRFFGKHIGCDRIYIFEDMGVIVFIFLKIIKKNM